MSRANATRRDFLKLAGAGTAGTALSAAASSYARIAGCQRSRRGRHCRLFPTASETVWPHHF